MKTQAENLASASISLFPARVDPVPLLPIPNETDPHAEKKAAKGGGSFRQESMRPRRRSTRAKRNLPEDPKKPNAKHATEGKSMPVLLRSSPKKKARIRSGQTVEPAAVQEQAIPSAPLPLKEEELPAVSEVWPEPAAASGTDDVVEGAQWSGTEIQADSCVPAENRSPLCGQDEPDWPAAEATTLAKTHTPRRGELAPRAEKTGLLTVTLRVRHRPLAVVLKALDSLLTQAWNWTQQKLRSPGGKKRLRVCESVSLGEKRFVAVIQVDGEQFLVGGSASSVSTLAHLERPREFSDVFERHCKQDLGPA